MSRDALPWFQWVICGAAIAFGATLGSAGTPSDMDEIRRVAASGFQAESVARARRVLAEAKSRAPGSAEEAAALDLNLEVLDNSGLECSAEARSLADRALRLKERLWGPDHPEVAQTLVLAARLRITDQPSVARDMLDRARSIQARTLGAADPALAETDYASYRLERHCGNDDLAREFELKALDISGSTSPADDSRTVVKRLTLALDSEDCEDILTELRDETLRNFGPGHPLTARAIFDLAMCRWKGRRFDQAREGMEEALAIQRAALGPAHLLVAETLLTLATLHANCGDRERAERLFRQSMASFTALAGADSPVMRLPLQQFSWFLELIGKSDEAFDTATRAMQLGAAKLDARCPQEVLRVASYGMALRDHGDLARAKTLLERTVETLDGAAAPDSVAYAAVLHSLGEILHDLGDDIRARQLLERSLAMRERVSGTQDISNWIVLTDLGSVLARFGELDAATAHLQRAIQLLKAGGSELAHGCISSVLRILADVQLRQGDLSGARATLLRALDIAVAVFGDQGGRVELILRDLCTLEGSVGGEDRDRSICARAVAVNERRYGPHHPGMARLLGIEAALSYADGDRQAALRLSIEAEQRSRSHFSRTVRTLSEREALSFELTRHTGLDVALTVLAAEAPDRPAAHAQRVWNEVLRSRSMVLDEVIVRRRAVSGGDAEARRLFENLEAARGQLSQTVRSSVDITDPGKARGKIAGAVARVDAAERTWHARQLERNGGGRADVGLKQVLAALPAGAALVAYVRYRHLDKSKPGAGMLEYAALIAASRSAPVEFIRLGPAERIDRMIADWSRAVGSEPAPGLGRSAESAYRQIAAPLRETIWDPVRARLGSPSLILVVPEGPLHLVALSTLPAGDGRYLVETDSPIQLLSTERDVAALATKPNFTGGLLALGDPAFDAVVDLDSGSAVGGAVRRVVDTTPDTTDSMPRGSNRCASFSSLEFQPLPQTIAEVEEVRRAWVAGHDGRLEPAPIVLLGTHATEQALKRHAAVSRVIHLATHGFVLPLQCIQPTGGLATSADEGWLTLAGLALAGANRRNTGVSTASDGIVTAEEIASLDLTRTEWVVLSACDSGWGTVLDGEGVFGLRRALQIAGARTTITSLWQVRDEAARDWMGRLYRARMDGDSTVAAVRSASLGALLSRRTRGLDTHPARWGAFAAVGDWR